MTPPHVSARRALACALSAALAWGSVAPALAGQLRASPGRPARGSAALLARWPPLQTSRFAQALHAATYALPAAPRPGAAAAPSAEPEAAPAVQAAAMLRELNVRAHGDPASPQVQAHAALLTVLWGGEKAGEELAAALDALGDPHGTLAARSLRRAVRTHGPAIAASREELGRELPTLLRIGAVPTAAELFDGQGRLRALDGEPAPPAAARAPGLVASRDPRLAPFDPRTPRARDAAPAPPPGAPARAPEAPARARLRSLGLAALALLSALSLTGSTPQLAPLYEAHAALTQPDGEQARALTDATLRRARVRGSAEEVAALRSALHKLVRTRTGGELAREFIASGGAAIIEFADIPESSLLVSDGRRSVAGTGGFASFSGPVPRVVINRLMLQVGGPDQRHGIAGNLAHEFFGHVLLRRRAQLAGELENIRYYRDDEMGARVVASLLMGELISGLADSDIDSYLSDPERYHREISVINAGYADDFSPAQMRALAPTLQERLRALAEERRRAEDGLRQVREARRAVRHFVEAHRYPAARFRALELEQATSERMWVNHLRGLDPVRSALDASLSRLRTPQGRRFARSLALRSHGSFYRAEEERLERLRRRLAELRGLNSRLPPPDAGLPAPDPAQLHSRGLSRMRLVHRLLNPRHPR